MSFLTTAVLQELNPSLKPTKAPNKLFGAFDWLTETSPHFSRLHQETGTQEAGEFRLQAYRFTGPETGCEHFRIGLFAGIHGDEIEGVLGLLQFANAVIRQPKLAVDYALYFYPVCNPSGLEAHTRHSDSGKDLQNEFWKNSAAPEVRFLESEITRHQFQGLIHLHSHRVTKGFYGIASDELTRDRLLQPALVAANQFVPLHTQATPGAILSPAQWSSRAANASAFEILLSSSSFLPLHLQLDAFTAALQTILQEHRRAATFI